jgi:hypothetical protein
MEWTTTNLIVQTLAGFAGAHCAAAALHDHRFGAIGHSLVGLIAGALSGYPGKFALGNPGPMHGRLTRFKATAKLLQLCAEHGITPDNVTNHFQFEHEMPRELVQLTSPFRLTPNTERTEKLRGEVAELNEFLAKHTITHPTIKHLGFVRKFHLAHHPDFRWNKGGRLYSYPSDANVNYQNVDQDRGRVRDYGDLMYTESEVIVGAMLILKREHGVPSMPVHDSLIVPRRNADLAKRVLGQEFRRETGTKPRLKMNDPWDF